MPCGTVRLCYLDLMSFACFHVLCFDIDGAYRMVIMTCLCC